MEEKTKMLYNIPRSHLVSVVNTLCYKIEDLINFEIKDLNKKRDKTVI